MATPATPRLWCWRHPKACGAAGRCIGHTDVPVRARKAKRLAHRMRAAWRRQRRLEPTLQLQVWASPLRRCAEVARWLRRWGLPVGLDARLKELHFGAWDGRWWNGIPWAEVEAWQADLLHKRPAGNGETLAELAARVGAFVQALPAGHHGAPLLHLAVTHGGWINAWQHVGADATHIDAAQWPQPPRHGRCVKGR